MPAASLWRARRDDLLAALRTMSKANGFYHDYGAVRLGIEIGSASNGDDLGFVWLPPSNVEDIIGSEQSQRMRNYHGFAVTKWVESRGGDHQGRAADTYLDIEKAVLSTDSSLGLARDRGSAGRSNTTIERVDWSPDLTEGRGGQLVVLVLVRMDHVTTQPATQG